MVTKDGHEGLFSSFSFTEPLANGLDQGIRVRNGIKDYFFIHQDRRHIWFSIQFLPDLFQPFKALRPRYVHHRIDQLVLKSRGDLIQGLHRQLAEDSVGPSHNFNNDLLYMIVYRSFHPDPSTFLFKGILGFHLLNQNQSIKIPSTISLFYCVNFKSVISGCSEDVNSTRFHHWSYPIFCHLRFRKIARILFSRGSGFTRIRFSPRA